MTRDAPLPRIGAQLSTAGGFAAVSRRALEVGAEAVQIFNTNPRIWRARVAAPEEIEALAAGLRERRLPLFFHSSYLINLASPDGELRRRSSESLGQALTTAALAGAEAVVTHVGSHRGEDVGRAEQRVVETISGAIAWAEAARPGGQGSPLPALLLETGAGGGNTIGGRLEELASLLFLEETRGLAEVLALGICIDTAHLFAAGYAVQEEAGLEDLITRFRALGLLDRIGLVHLNDSRTPFASRRDHHENLGRGLIGRKGLAGVIRNPALANVPFILEVPGADGHGPDKANVALAKSLRARPGRRGAPGAPGRPAPRPRPW